MFKRQAREVLKLVLPRTCTKMVAKVVICVLITVGSVCSRILENESEQYVLDKQDSEKDSTLNSRCALTSCTKRALQDDVGPFWANRGKKDPRYRSEPLTADEPHWVLVRRAEDDVSPFKYNFEPFFITRGKKDKKEEDKNIMFGTIRYQNFRDTQTFKNVK